MERKDWDVIDYSTGKPYRSGYSRAGAYRTAANMNRAYGMDRYGAAPCSQAQPTGTGAAVLAAGPL